MKSRNRYTAFALLAAIIVGTAIAGVYPNFAIAGPGQNPTHLLGQFSSQPTGTIVSIIDGATGNYTNYLKDGNAWVQRESGYSPEHDPNAGGGNGSGGDPSPGGNGNGGTSNPSGPSTGGGLCWSCTGTVTPGVPRPADD